MKSNCNCIYHLANVATRAQKKSQVEICETANETGKGIRNEKRNEMKRRRKVHKKKGEIVVHLCGFFSVGILLSA